MLRKTALFLSILLLAGHAYAFDWVALTGNKPGELSISATTSVSGNTIVDVRLDGYYTEIVSTNSGNTLRLMLPGGVNETETGYPNMQHLAISLQIQDKGKTKLTILSSEYTEFENVLIAPSQGDPQFINPSNRNIFSSNELIYNSNEFYPNALARADAPYVWCDARGQAVQVYPFSYNPVAKTLRVYQSIRFEISNTNEPGKNELTRFGPDYGTLKGMRSAAGSHFANYTNSNRNLQVDEPGNMLIITQLSFIEVLQPFIEWKARTGIVCEVVDAAGIGNAAAIRQFVADYYYSKGLSYLLLAGDDSQVPSLQAENGASDNMYGYIAGDDHYPEVVVGRFPAETADQLETMVNRSINYEKNPSALAGYDNFLGIASELGPGDDGEADFEHIRKIGNTLLESDYRIFNEMYDGSHEGTDAAGNPTWSGVETAINDGLGAIMYIGHGTKNVWTTSGFSSSNVLGLENTEFQPFIWSAGCSNGDFVESTCFAEAWLRAESNGKPAGAVAVMMSTSTQSWYPPMEAQDEIALILSGKKASVTTRTFGGISMSACMKMNDKYGTGGYRVTDTWTIFGDPSIMVRTAPAQDILTHHAPVYGADTRVFVVKLPGSNALACITQHKKLLGGARAADDYATISISGQLTPDSITLTVTGYNRIPYTAVIAITRMPAAAIQVLPENNSHKVSVYTNLAWQTGTGMIPGYYEVFLAKGTNPDWSENGVVVNEKSFAPPQELAYNTTYTWKVISHNQYGQTESENFTFTTIAPPDEDFENQGFPRSNWTNNSHNQWYLDGNNSFEGQFSLRSGVIGNSDTSRLAYECFTPSCDYLGFRKMVSSQAGADKLQLLIDGLLAGEWSGQSGWSEEIYSIGAGNHLIEWIYYKDSNGSDGSDAAWIDNIYLPENAVPVVISEDFTTCSAAAIPLNAQVQSYSRIEWESAGEGTFSDTTALTSTYYPAAEELESGSLKLFLNVYSNPFCEPVSHEVNITLANLPVLPQVNDTTIYAGETIEIEIPDNGNSAYKLMPAGVSGNRFLINADELQTGANLLTIESVNEAGCSAEIVFTVTKPEGLRPSVSSGLSLYPNPARETISFSLEGSFNGNIQIQVFNISGQLVMQREPDAGFHNSLDLAGLNEGIYLIRVKYGDIVKSGRFIKTI